MSYFVDLLAKDGSVTINKKFVSSCHGNVKVHKNMSTELMQGLFYARQIHFNLKIPNHFAIPSINSVNHGSESLSNLGPRVRN